MGRMYVRNCLGLYVVKPYFKTLSKQLWKSNRGRRLSPASQQHCRTPKQVDLWEFQLLRATWRDLKTTTIKAPKCARLLSSAQGPCL